MSFSFFSFFKSFYSQWRYTCSFGIIMDQSEKLGVFKNNIKIFNRDLSFEILKPMLYFSDPFRKLVQFLRYLSQQHCNSFFEKTILKEWKKSGDTVEAFSLYYTSSILHLCSTHLSSILKKYKRSFCFRNCLQYIWRYFYWIKGQPN